MPLPEPLLPPLMLLMKLLLLTAVQVQLVPLAVMTMLLEPPAALKLAVVEVGATLQATPGLGDGKGLPADGGSDRSG